MKAALGLLLVAAAAVAQAPRPLADLQADARKGDPQAMFQLGEAYRTGTGVAADRDQALAWFKRAADQGNRPARDAMGMLMFTRGNRQEAMPLIEAAAARGDPRALYILATARFNGDYVARDWPRAYAEMSRAAELGLPQAKASLAQMEPYLLPADRARADDIRATLAAVSAGGGAPLSPPPIVTTMPAPTAAPAPSPPAPVDLGVARVAQPGAPDRGYSLATAAGSRTAPATIAPPAPVAPAPAAAPATLPAPPPVHRAPPSPPVQRPTSPPPSAGTALWRVQLGAYGSSERAEAQWRALAARVSALAGHAHAVTPVGALFRLQAQDVAGREEANRLCHDVVAAGAGCFPIAP